MVVPKPEPEIEKAEMEVVAIPAIVVVERNKSPPAFLNAHWARPPPADKASCEADDENGLRRYVGVVVPKPIFPPLAIVKATLLERSVDDAILKDLSEEA